MVPVLPPTIEPAQAPTALAPMQDVTTLPFMRVVAAYGPPDYFFTEYFRVYATSILDRPILDSIVHNDTGRPVFAQLIGEDVFHILRTIDLLKEHPVAGIDLNMGCPAPKVYKKNVGGGLLRDPRKVDDLLGAMRAAIPGRFSVKMRIGFDSAEHFDELLDLMNRHRVDFVSLHGRTVKEMYRGEVHYDYIAHAKRRLCCPLFANGNITSARVADTVLRETGADGAMIGRSAIRNPWIFRQIREFWRGEEPFTPTLADVYDYIERLWEATSAPEFEDFAHAAYMKKFLNFVGQGVDPEGAFLKRARRARDGKELFAICEEHLLTSEARDRPFASEPYDGVVARPNHEAGEPEQSCQL